jgi:hypothetical protein
MWTFLIAFLWLNGPDTARNMSLADCKPLSQQMITKLQLKPPVTKEGGIICVGSREYSLLEKGYIPKYKAVYVRY